MRADQERVKKLLVDTVTLLCKNGLFYQEELRVEGLLGVTLDGSDVFFVHISQKLMSGEEPHADVLLPSDLTLAPTNSHGDIRDDALDVTPNNKMPDCHDNRIVIRPAEERGQHSRSASPSRYQQSSRSSIHSEDSNSMVDGQDLRRGTKREQEENAMESVKYLRRPDPSSRVPMPQDDSELVHPQGPPGETLHPNFSQFDQLIAAANQASSGEAGGGKRRAYVGSGGEPSGHALPPSGAFVTGIARSLHGEAANTPGPAGAGGPGAGAQGGAGGGSNEWPNTTSALEMAAHLAQSQTPGQLSVDTSALASTSSWPNTPISSAGQGPGVGQFGATDMFRKNAGYRPRTSPHKTYACDEPGCDKSFYHSHNLYRHKRTKHGAPALRDPNLWNRTMQYEGRPEDDAVLQHLQSIREKLSCGPGGDPGGPPHQQGYQHAPPWAGAGRSDSTDQKDQDMFCNLRELFQKQNEQAMLMNIKEEDEDEEDEEEEENEEEYMKSEERKQTENGRESNDKKMNSDAASSDTNNAHPKSDEENPNLNPNLKNTDTLGIKTEPTEDN